MLPIKPDEEQLQLMQKQLQVRIDELNQLKSWGSGDDALVSDSQIQSIVENSFESLKSCPNSSLSSSLFQLTERIQSAEDVGLKLKDLAWNVENSLSALNVRNYKNTNLQVLEKLGIADLSHMSRVSKFGNEMGKEVILAKIQKLGYEGKDYDEAVEYLIGLKSGVYELRLSELNYLTYPVLNGILKEATKTKKHKEFASIEEEMIGKTLDKLKTLPVPELIGLCTNVRFYKPECANLRKFIVRNYDINSSFEDDKLPKQILGYALKMAATNYEVDILKFLLDLGIAPDTKYGDKTALESVNHFNHQMMLAKEPENPKHQEVVDLLTNKPKKPE